MTGFNHCQTVTEALTVMATDSSDEKNLFRITDIKNFHSGLFGQL